MRFFMSVDLSLLQCEILKNTNIYKAEHRLFSLSESKMALSDNVSVTPKKEMRTFLGGWFPFYFFVLS